MLMDSNAFILQHLLNENTMLKEQLQVMVASTSAQVGIIRFPSGVREGGNWLFVREFVIIEKLTLSRSKTRYSSIVLEFVKTKNLVREFGTSIIISNDEFFFSPLKFFLDPQKPSTRKSNPVKFFLSII